MINKAIQVVLASLFLTATVLAQSTFEFDSRLSSKFSKDELSSMTVQQLNYWSAYLTNSVEVIELPAEKLSGIEETVELESTDKSKINLFKLGIEPHEFARDYRRISGSNKVLVIKPVTEIEKSLSKVYTSTEEDLTPEELAQVAAMGGGPVTVAITDGGSTTLPCGFGAQFEHSFEDDNPAGPYAANSNYTVTVCPDGTNGSKVTLRMFPEVGDTWDVHGSDTLFVYDGTDTNAPLIGAFNSDTDTNGISVR